MDIIDTKKQKYNNYINEYKKNRMKNDEEYKQRILEQNRERNKRYRLKIKTNKIENIKTELSNINISNNLNEYIKLSKKLIKLTK